MGRPSSLAICSNAAGEEQVRDGATNLGVGFFSNVAVEETDVLKAFFKELFCVLRAFCRK